MNKRKLIDYEKAYKALVCSGDVDNDKEGIRLNPCIKCGHLPIEGRSLSCGGRYQFGCDTCKVVTEMYLMDGSEGSAALEWNDINKSVSTGVVGHE